MWFLESIGRGRLVFSYWIVGLELQCLFMEVSVNDDAILDSVVSLFCK